MTEPAPEHLEHRDAVLGLLCSRMCLMTAAFEDDRAGQVVRSAQVCADVPLLVAVASKRGHAIDPLIRDSRGFALLIVDPADKLLAHKFAPEPDRDPDEAHDRPTNEDPFDTFQVSRLVTGSPVISRCVAAIDCEVVRHFDIEADTELYVGAVLATKLYKQPG